MSPVNPLPYDPALSSDAAFNTLLSSIHSPSLPAGTVALATPVVSHNAFFDSLRNPELRVHDSTKNPTPETANLTLTDNGGITFANTESPTLDLFTELGSVDKDALPDLLDAAWAANPLETLQIIWNARSIPRGKGRKEPWVRGSAWLAERHPRTLLRNLEWIVRPTDLIPRKRKAVEVEEERETEDGDLCEQEEEDPELNPRTARSHGYFKDLLNILVLSALPSTSTPSATQLSVLGDYTRVPGLAIDHDSPYAPLRSKSKKGRKAMDVDEGAKAVSDATRIEQVLATDGSFHRALHITVARIFGQQLRDDLSTLDAAKASRDAGHDAEALAFESRISLAAKWAPTEGQFHDAQTRIASSIAEFLTPLAEPRTSSGVVRSLTHYRTRFLAPLRKHLDLVESRMSARDWSNVKYSRVPSIAMSKNTPHFYKHDADGFKAYLLRVAEGKETISGATMTPAKLFVQANGRGVEAEVAEAQWNTLVSSIHDTGKLSRCIAVSDVSGSMMSPRLDDGTTPMDSSIALSILIAQVTEPPFANAVISFTDRPSFVDLTGTTLREHRAQITRRVGYNTDFIAVFERILERATEAKLPQEQMIERVFVFSDMEFDSCHEMGDSYATHYDVAKAKYTAAGYEIPELVFWNLASSQRRTSKPVAANQPGTALVSGYSVAIVKVFLEGGEFEDEGDEVETVEEVEEETGTVVVKKVKVAMTPVDVMRKSVGHKSFEGLKVYD